MLRAREVVTGVALCVCLLGAGFAEPQFAEPQLTCEQVDQNHVNCSFPEECSNLNGMTALCAAWAYLFGWVVEGVGCSPEMGGACLFHVGSV
jgi:hypothetical protein